MSFKNNGAKAQYKNCGCGEGTELTNNWPDKDKSQHFKRSISQPTHVRSSRNNSLKVVKSVSDTLVLVKGCTFPKALSMNRLSLHQIDNLPNPGELTDSTSSSDIFLGDQPHEATMCDKQNEQHIPALIPATKKAEGENRDTHADLRNRKLKRGNPSPENKIQPLKNHEDEIKKTTPDDTQEMLGNVEEALFDEQQMWKESRAYYICWIILTVLSLLTRIYNIEVPAHICWDETHFGKMGSWYINRTFFFDVHPPLGKMLIGLAGLVTGYDGSFPFNKPGDAYGDINYVGMRVFCAVLGAFLVPLAYQSVWLLTHSMLASIFAGVLILFDTGTLTLSRHILLDPILMFFIMMATYSFLKFLTYRTCPFSVPWWFWMLVAGVSLAASISVKFVGLFIILLVGYTTATDLWRLLGDLHLSLFTFVKHLVARIICLIIVPALIYCAIFAVHFHVLNQSGNGDGFFSSGFQSQLIGNKLYNVSMPQHIAFGSIITLKQRRTGGAYLHSHAHLYPEEHPPKQQQVTSYSHKDDNNKWKIKPAEREVGSNEDIIFVHNGDLIRLEHVATHRNLHSHREVAPLSKHHFQVTGYGQNGTGDANDIWLVEVESASRGDKVQTVRSKIRFIHYHVRCLLHSHDKKLPKWGWEQLEVTCQPNMRDTTSAWSVEEVIDARLPNVSFEVYTPSFIEKFLESHAVMTQGNSGLKPKEGEITSHPWQWPIDYKGQAFSGQEHRIYMLGNPIIFWALLVIKVTFLLLWISFSVSRKRRLPISNNLKVYCERTFRVCWWLLLAWLLHYLPFWGMSRVLYFHHYFPAFLYSAMFGGVMLDFQITLVCVSVPESFALTVFHWCLFVISGLILWSFYLFYPLVYGMSGPMANEEASTMHRVKWLDSWEL